MITKPGEIIQSDNDTRNYRYLELENNLKVLLISDPFTEKSAASLDVYAGSRQDPIERQGLAHFLEHMLFLGTRKYPKAGEYQTYINVHGGSHNAYTSFEHTNFFFDIESEYLEGALDRFSQFFISPLFTQAYIDRELNSVHSEYKSKMRGHQRKSLDVFKALVNSDHPYSKFSVGNQETLQGYRRGAVRNQLINFYTKYYNAGAMTLAVIGNKPLADLEEIVKKRFSGIVNNHREITPVTVPLFSKGTLPILVNIKPERELRTLDFAFPCEGGIDFYQHKPMEYIGNILQHEGKGSLLSFLKSKGWVDELSAGVGLNYTGGSTFNISIQLTASAVYHVDEITKAVFQTINRIRVEDGQKRIYSEQKSLSQQQFKYKEKEPPMVYVQKLSADMHLYKPRDLLRGPYMMAGYNSELIERFLTYLTPSNVIITVNSPEVITEQVTHFYGTHYGLAPITQEQLDFWEAAGINDNINLPEENIFIADDFKIKPLLAINNADNPHSTGALFRHEYPQKIVDEPGIRLWFKQDSQYFLPKGSLFIDLRSPIASDSAKNNAFLKMYIAMVSDQLNELSYPAKLAGLSFSLRDHPRGFTIKIKGFDDKQFLLLEKILAVLKSPGFTEVSFNRIKNEYLRKLKNSKKQQSYRLTMSKLPQLLRRDYWTEQQLALALKKMSLHNLQKYSARLVSSGSAEMLVHGNFRRRESIAYAKRVASVLASKTLAPNNIEIVRLPAEYTRLVDGTYNDAAIVFYLQSDETRKSDRAAMGLTSQIISAQYFNELRTERQLGYVVSAGVYPLMDVPGLYFLVQSPTAGPSQLQAEIEEFIKRREIANDNLTPELFNQHKLAFLSLLREEPQNLMLQSERYWQDITQSYYHFDLQKQLINEVEALTLKQWQLFYKSQVAAKSRKGMWVYSTGAITEKNGVKGIVISDLDTFKSNSKYYSFK